ncbi:S-adenosyl-L-methionine-dependent methyltransferase [Hyaloscypha sp. PMI_1271]|nr:S-adenosyl-L-methionine-dependent methyltransferase [Hyaloscypha sp. PMI_1271]
MREIQKKIRENADDFNDQDSAIGSTRESSSASIGSSILRYREENGRTYHAYKEGTYILPNDEADLQHHMFTLTFGGKLSTVIDKSQKLHRVLDVGTGTGIWAIDFADEHPEAQVIGIDLSPIQPAFTPPNLTFYVDDAEDPWTYTEKFDFIYSRMMTGSIAKWPEFIAQAKEFLNPGGQLEIVDIVFPIECDDGTLSKDSALMKWSNFMAEAADKLGRKVDSAKRYREQLEEAGFTDVVETRYKWPQNRWPKDQAYKELGMWTVENLTTGLQGLSLALFTRGLGWSAEELEVFLIDVRNDMKNTRIHAYWNMWVLAHL